MRGKSTKGPHTLRMCGVYGPGSGFSLDYSGEKSYFWNQRATERSSRAFRVA